jgi:F0F1-type ATP synthase membrane subunit b/b'
MNPTVLVTVAAGDSHPLIDIDWTVAIQLALFLIMFVVANKLLFQPYLRLREKRAEGIEGAKAEAERMTAEADAKLVEYEKQLAVARTKASEESRKIRAEAAAYERDTTAAARASASAAMEEAQKTVRTQTEAARKDLLPRAEALGKQMAGRLLGREVA